MSPGGRKFRPVAVISCDISGHSTAAEHQQLANVTAINRIVGKAIRDSPKGDVVWSSGGDGGHVVLRAEHWQETALDLVKNLTRWASSTRVTLRTTGHYGSVAEFKGADGRVQLVGEGINYAGWLINHLDVAGVVVSDSFVANFGDAGVDFHDARLVPANGFGPRLIHLLSFDGVSSSWNTLVNHDHTRLRKAEEDGLGWEVLLYAMRVWQINSEDAKATAAVKGLLPEQLRPAVRSTEKRRLGLFDYMSPGELRDILHIGQLVERQAGSTVCAYDDEGDTMFVILRGEVGVYNTEGSGLGGSAKELYRLQQGELIGELAHALGRRRTADLIALTDIALLSFSSAELDRRLRNESTRAQVRRFIAIRVLEHAGDNADYLVGRTKKGPLSRGGGADRALDALSDHARLLDVDPRHLEVGPEVLGVEAVDRKGLYILAAGTLSRKNGELLDGTKFPLLWADAPGLAETGERRYERKSDMVKILQIAEDGLTALDVDQRRALRRRIAPREADAFEYDAFISYAHADDAVVRELCDTFDRAGIRYWVDFQRMPPGRRVPREIGDGIDGSRFFVACVSRAYLVSDWAMAEWESVITSDTARDRKALLVLLIDDTVAEGDLPALARPSLRTSWSKPGEVEKLVAHLKLDDRPASRG